MRWLPILAILATAAITAALMLMADARSFAAWFGQSNSSSSVVAVGTGKPIADFTLPDCAGRRRSLSEWANKSVVVVTFVGTECPIVARYRPRLNELARRFAPHGVAFVGINSNRQDSAAELARWARRANFQFPVLKDAGNVVADSFGAVRTPEVFVLDAQRRVRYRGRIDDQFGTGYRRPKALHRDLEDALGELLAGLPVRRATRPVEGCLIGREPPRQAAGSVTWSKDIARILERRCQRCHRPGQSGPLSLLTYEDALGWREMIREVVLSRRMPPWHAMAATGQFANDARVSDEEIALVDEWVVSGAPEGNSADPPPTHKYFSEGPSPTRERIIAMSDTPCSVRAEGPDVYRYFFVDPGFQEDQWIGTAWCQPGNVAVVRDINVYFRPPWQRWNGRPSGEVNLLARWRPGQTTADLRAGGAAVYVPAESELLFELHYVPNGARQTDLSRLGLVRADQNQVRRKLLHVAAMNDRFVIPARASDFRVRAAYRFEQEAELLCLAPRMRQRGESFLFEARYPDQRRETLLEVVGYDERWQTAYWLSQPKFIPEGTAIHCLARYDNSRNNPRNPNPPVAAHAGNRPGDETMAGTLGIARPVLPRATDSPREASGTARGVRSTETNRERRRGDDALDRGQYLRDRGDRKGSLRHYGDAIAHYQRAGAYRDMTRAVTAKASVIAWRLLPRAIAYLIVVNGLALVLWTHETVAAQRGWRRVPWLVLVLVALAGGTPVALWMRAGRRSRRHALNTRSRILPMVAAQLVVVTLCLSAAVAMY